MSVSYGWKADPLTTAGVVELLASMQRGSMTNGWDAICAYDTERINSMFYHQYCAQGPTTPGRYVAFMLEADDPDYYAMLSQIGPPEVMFSPDVAGKQCQVSMYLTGGTFARLSIDDDAKIRSIIRILPNTSQLSGVLDLKKVSGEVDEGGTVRLDLGSGAYTPTIGGVSPDIGTQVGDAIRTFFATNVVQYDLGTVVYSKTDVPAALQPQDFDLVTQTSGNGDGCLVLLIRTDGTAGAPGPLPVYPIPEGYSATVIVSNRVMFNDLVPKTFTNEFSNYGTEFLGQQNSSGTWQSVGGGGTINLDVIRRATSYDSWETTNSNKKPTSLVLPLSLIVTPQSNALQASWTLSWKQGFTHTWTANRVPSSKYETVDMRLTVNVRAQASMSKEYGWGLEEVVSFSGSPSIGVTCSQGYKEVGDTIAASVRSELQSLFKNMTFPHVSVFALGNLVFPQNHILTLSQASVPQDLVVFGDVNPVVTVSPAQVNLQPGQQQQFQAVYTSGQTNQDFIWGITPLSRGQITQQGLYTAPSNIGNDAAVTITATSKADLKKVGYATAFIYSSPAVKGVEVKPASVILTAGQAMLFEAKVEAENNQEVTWASSPALGRIVPSAGTAKARYVAPEEITSSQDVTITATSTADSTKSGSATVTLSPSVQVQVTPEVATLAPGKTQQFSVTVTNDDDPEVTWLLYPVGQGSVSATGLYTAPADIKSRETVLLTALYLDVPVGAGFATLTLEPTGE